MSRIISVSIGIDGIGMSEDQAELIIKDKLHQKFNNLDFSFKNFEHELELKENRIEELEIELSHAEDNLEDSREELKATDERLEEAQEKLNSISTIL
ncbi:MAG: hypothetical protein GY804_02535 [Alphaproteobacteria bacterium]|nr:hypothetical protein [Alphaproteobacteria bacterium]